MSCSITISVSPSASASRRSVSSCRSPRERPEHGSAEQLDGAGGRREVAADDVEERRLPGPVRAEDRAALARADLEVDVPDGVEAAEPPADPPQAEGRLGVFGCCCFCQTPT